MIKFCNGHFRSFQKNERFNSTEWFREAKEVTLNPFFMDRQSKSPKMDFFTYLKCQNLIECKTPPPPH
jgi:hypothetical protein